MSKRKPQVGDMADHKSRELDLRPVEEVSGDGTGIRLRIGALTTGWLPASNYTFHEIGAGL